MAGLGTDEENFGIDGPFSTSRAAEMDVAPSAIEYVESLYTASAGQRADPPVLDPPPVR